MIRLRSLRLPAEAKAKLADYQAKVDSLATYEQRVTKAKKSFASTNTKRNKTFQQVKRKLDQMCSGARRCCYCEDSYADEVEHIYPKSLFPERCFIWRNYLYACGPCNGPKNNLFAVFARGSAQVIEVSRRADDPVVPPRSGKPVFLDPRRDHPMDFLMLDFQTFRFVVIAEKATREYRRGEYTLKTLRLNEREALPRARAAAFHQYHALLHQYVYARNRNAPASELRRLKKALQSQHHPTVWREMLRQADRNPLLQSVSRLLAQAAEARTWRFP